MKLILFDLDGTLLSAGGIGRRSTRYALQTVVGSDGNLDKFYPGGRTQEAIFRDTLLDMGHSSDDYLQIRELLYQHFLDKFQREIEAGNHQIRPLPGAVELINHLADLSGVTLGVVTGNHSLNARIKLEKAGIPADHFQVGAYGEESADRSDLIPLAKERAFRISGQQSPGKMTAVVGDTTRDVISGKSVGAISLALTSGTDDRELLESAGPDHILDDLRGLDQVVDILLAGD